MAAVATRIAKQTAKTYQSILLVRERAQDKLDALLASQAAYRIFEHDEAHPYYGQVKNAQRFVDTFELLASMVLGVDTGNGTIEFELDKLRATLIVKDKEKDAGFEALSALPIASTIEAKKLGEQVAGVYESAIWIWSFCDLKATTAQLEKLHEKKHIKRHLEVPYINMTSECRNAVKDVKKLVAMLLNLTVNDKSVRLELESKRATNPSKSFDILLALKDK